MQRRRDRLKADQPVGTAVAASGRLPCSVQQARKPLIKPSRRPPAGLAEDQTGILVHTHT
jgi:hypothetical protein